MPKLVSFSGKQVIKVLASFGFREFGRRGSHVKLIRVFNGLRQTLTIPDHRVLDKGTLRGIFNQACRYISADELRPHFYK